MPVPRLRFDISTVLAIAAVLTFAGLAVANALAKAPWWNEGWFASPALNLVTTGTMGTSILAPVGDLRGVDRHTYWVPPLYLVALAGWFKLAGFSLLRQRAFSILWGLVALGAWATVMRTCTGRRGPAILALALLSTDAMFVGMSSEGRMDVMCVALTASAFATYLLARRRHLAAALGAAHALAAAAVLTHPSGVFAVLGLVAFAWSFDRRRIDRPLAALAALPYVLGAAAWMAYALQSPHDFVIQLGANANRVQGLAHPLDALRGELRRWVDTYVQGPPWSAEPVSLHVHPARAWPLIVPLIYAAALVATLRIPVLRRDPTLRVLGGVLAAMLLGMTFLEGNKRYYYLIYVTPVCVMFLARAVAWGWERRTAPRWALAACVTVVMTANVALALRPVRADSYRNGFVPAVRWLDTHARRSQVIFGSSELAFGLGFRAPLVDDYRLGLEGGPSPDVVVMGVRYDERLRAESPAMRRAIEARLAGYAEAWAVGRYRIYLPRARATTAAVTPGVPVRIRTGPRG